MASRVGRERERDFSCRMETKKQQLKMQLLTGGRQIGASFYRVGGSVSSSRVTAATARQ